MVFIRKISDSWLRKCAEKVVDKQRSAEEVKKRNKVGRESTEIGITELQSRAEG